MAFSTFTEWNAVGLHVGEWGQATGFRCIEATLICTERSPVFSSEWMWTGLRSMALLCSLFCWFFFNAESHVAQVALHCLSPPLEQTPRWWHQKYSVWSLKDWAFQWAFVSVGLLDESILGCWDQASQASNQCGAHFVAQLRAVFLSQFPKNGDCRYEPACPVS